MLPIDLDLLLPEEYAAWRPLLEDALAFFVGHLSPERRRELLAVQAVFAPPSALVSAAEMADRLAALLRQCPTLHKLGQVLARDPRLHPELRARLTELESQPASTSLGEVRRLAASHVDMRGMRLDEPPIAAGSVAVVVPFSHVSGQSGVLKLLKPGIEVRLYEELAIWSALAEWIAGRCHRYGLPVLNLRNTLEEVRDLLLNEIRLDVEQSNMRRADRLYAEDEQVVIPRVLSWSTRNVTAMTRVEGVKITDARTVRPEDLVRALIVRPFLSMDENAMVHADPHAGNLFATPDGRLAVLDWSLVTFLGKSERVALMQALLAGLTLDAAALRDALEQLAGQPRSEAAMDYVLDAALRAMRENRHAGFDWLVDLLDAAVMRGGLSLRGNLVLFRKALLTVSHVARAMDSDVSIGDVMREATVQRLLTEMPWRMCAPLDSRASGTHLSTLDLYRVVASWPLTAARYWLGTWRDVASSEESLQAIHVAASA